MRGFSVSHDTAGLRSLTKLFSANYCGLYVLHFANEEFYAGLAKDVRRRFLHPGELTLTSFA